MYQKIQFWQFEHEFNQIRPDNFSSEALRILFDWFEELEEQGCGEQELDVIAICCDFTECTFEEFRNDYLFNDDDLDEFSTDDELRDAIQEHLDYHTCFVGWTSSNTVVFRAF